MACVVVRNDPVHHDARAPARAAFWIFCAFSVFYVGTTRGHFISTDEVGLYQQTHSLWEDGNLSVYTTDANNRWPGRNGRYYTVSSAGQSIAALPLYGLGKAISHALNRFGQHEWVRTLAGPDIARGEQVRFGGTVDIFFVSLLNSFVTALLCAVFFACSLRLGTTARWSLVSTALLGLTSYIAPFSTSFFQHSSEALLVLWAFLLLSDAEQSHWKQRACAGAAIAVLLVVRFPALVALPGLTLYLIVSVYRRRPAGLRITHYLRPALRQILPFAVLVAVGLMLHAAVQYWKFETVVLTGNYANARFNTPLLKGLQGLLLSPGDSIFLYTPLLLLSPWTFRHFRLRHQSLAACILFTAACYLVFFAKDEYWHGLWCFGPRYLAAVVPLLLLPLGSWMERSGRKAWLVVAPLAAAGFWVQLIHVAVNFWYVDLHEHYPDFQPPYEFLFRARDAPILAHSRALLAADWRVDMWLVNVYRAFGPGRVLVIAVALLALLTVCLWRLARSVRALEATPEPAVALRFVYRPQRALAAFGLLVIGTAVGNAVDHREGIGRALASPSQRTEAESDVALMGAGLDALYAHHDPTEAIRQFRAVLAHNPTHYGATYQLAAAFDAAGEPRAARPWWVKALALAEAYHDEPTARAARTHIDQTH